MNGPIISVIIPVYNNERYLNTAVDSVLHQDLNNNDEAEIIIVNDGSTDNTPAIANEIAASDDRVKVINQDNQWIYASMNNGIRAASGEYIYILNSDDALLNSTLKKIVDCVERCNKPDVVWTKVLWRDVDEYQGILSEHEMNQTVIKDEYIDNVEEVRDRWLFVQESYLALNQANLYKRELALKHPFRNDYYAADSFFNIRIADDIKSMAIMKDPIYVYMSYNKPQMNASVGKYYGYEHRMFNELMKEEINLYKGWNRLDVYLDSVVLKRLREMTYEIEILRFKNCTLSFREKLYKIFTETADPFIREYSRIVGREREYESRILNGTKAFVNSSERTEEIPDFINTLIRNLPDDYRSNVNKDLLDEIEMNHAVNDDLNTDNIGMLYYSTNW